LVKSSIQIIHDEHTTLASMLRSIGMMLDRGPGNKPQAYFDVMRAMLFYIDEFPERLHHPKESTLLFPKLRERCPELAPVMARLDEDHAMGEREVRDLQHALLGYELLGEPRREAFESAAQNYVKAYLEHMAIEEREILPAAQRSFSGEDWRELDAAFAANCDPLTGHEAAAEFQPLFRRILMAAPAPIGLGPNG
jgi:hemerythrin-like domain-containing protein